jgi:transposase
MESLYCIGTVSGLLKNPDSATIASSTNRDKEMRGEANPRPNMFSYIALESRIPNSHQIRKIRRIVDTALEDLESTFDEMYDNQGRPSIPPDQLLRAQLLQILFTIRSERQLMVRG